MNKKRVAREFCFQYFFHLQLPVFQELRREIQLDSHEYLRESIGDLKETTNTLLDEEQNQFVISMIEGTLKNYQAIEEIIQKNLKNWRLNRLSKVDNTTLLLAVYELCFEKNTSKNIIINEAIEIAKKFGTSDSQSFVNGILDNISNNESTAS